MQTMMIEANHPEPSNYEAPAIEKVLDAEDLEREVLYAGNAASVIPN